MRVVTYQSNGDTGVGVWDGTEVAPTKYDDMIGFIRGGTTSAATAHFVEARTRPDRVLAPLLRPGKIICCGFNYPAHRAEDPAALTPELPYFFSKLPTAVIGPNEAIVIPIEGMQVDYEVELAVVMGRRAYRVPSHEAMEYVFGYTILNDVSARDIQFKDDQITLGKGVDTFCPLGPEIVTADEIPRPDDLSLATFVNGQERQRALVSEMIVPIPMLIEVLTRFVTLEAGDVVATGTPAGVGCFRDPPVFLQPGDVVTVEVERIGQLTNPVMAGW